MDLDGDPVYGDELDAIINDIFDSFQEYAVSNLNRSEVVRGDFGVEVYWQKEQSTRFILATAYDSQVTYLSTGYSSPLGEEDIVELGFVSLDNLSEQLEAAKGTVEGIEPSI